MVSKEKCTFFFIYLDSIHLNSDQKMMASHFTLEIRTCNLWGFHGNRFFFREVARLHQKKTVFNENNHRYQVLAPKKHVTPSFFSPSSSERVKKKIVGFPLKPEQKSKLRGYIFFISSSWLNVQNL